MKTTERTFNRIKVKGEIGGKPIRGLYYRMGTQPNGKPERIFYVTFTRTVDGIVKDVEVKAGREKTEDWSESRAIAFRQRLIDGEKTPSEKRDAEADKAQADKTAEATRLTFDKLWAAYQEANPSYSRIKTDQSNYRNYIETVVGKKTAAEVTDSDIEQVNGKIARKKLSPATAKNILALLVRIATYGVEKKRCPGLNVPVDLPEVHNERTEELTAEQTSRLLTILKDGYYTDKKGEKHTIDTDARDIVLLAINTGMRRGEILKTEWKSVNFESGFIYVPKPKEGKPKRIPMNSEVAAVLQSRQDNGSEFVFPGKSGGHLVDPKRSLNIIKKAAGLPSDFRPCHGLRHVFASILASSGKVDLFTLQTLLGHGSSQMTRRYAHLANDSLKKAANVMSGILAPKESTSNVVSIK